MTMTALIKLSHYPYVVTSTLFFSSSFHRCCAAVETSFSFTLHLRQPALLCPSVFVPRLSIASRYITITLPVALQLIRVLAYSHLAIMAVATPIIQKISPLPVPPFLLDDKVVDTLLEAPPLDLNVAQPLRACPHSSRVPCIDQPRPASWTLARKRPSGGRMPQAIAHRGYRAKHPENTMGAFQGAVKAKAHAIETDVHLTKDDVVILSHVGSGECYDH